HGTNVPGDFLITGLNQGRVSDGLRPDQLPTGLVFTGRVDLFTLVEGNSNAAIAHSVTGNIDVLFARGDNQVVLNAVDIGGSPTGRNDSSVVGSTVVELTGRVRGDVEFGIRDLPLGAPKFDVHITGSLVEGDIELDDCTDSKVILQNSVVVGDIDLTFG